MADAQKTSAETGGRSKSVQEIQYDEYNKLTSRARKSRDKVPGNLALGLFFLASLAFDTSLVVHNFHPGDGDFIESIGFFITPLELALTSYYLAQGVTNSRQAKRCERLAGSIILRLDAAPASTDPLNDLPEGSPLDIPSGVASGVERAMLETVVAEVLPGQLARLGIVVAPQDGAPPQAE